MLSYGLKCGKCDAVQLHYPLAYGVPRSVLQFLSHVLYLPCKIIETSRGPLARREPFPSSGDEKLP